MEKEIASSDDGVALRASELYHENSKQQRFDAEFSRRIYLVNNNASFHGVLSRSFKSHPGAEFMSLPAVAPADGPPFETVAALRRSIRRFDGQPISLLQLARLLYFAGGLTGRLDATEHGVMQPVRAAPSGGALYPVELYMCAIAVQGLQQGLYHYAVDRHGLELLQRGNMAERLSEATSDAAMISRAAVVFILAGMFGRGQFKYGERSYRFALLEAGHICQNLLLEATALQLGAVAVGGFIDDEINQMLDVDGVDEAAIYLVAAGQPAARPAVRTARAERVIDDLFAALWQAGTVTNPPSASE
jgi:SagB-type dehydrogenase family enzyme